MLTLRSAILPVLLALMFACGYFSSGATTVLADGPANAVVSIVPAYQGAPFVSQRASTALSRAHTDARQPPHRRAITTIRRVTITTRYNYCYAYYPHVNIIIHIIILILFTQSVCSWLHGSLLRHGMDRAVNEQRSLLLVRDRQLTGGLWDSAIRARWPIHIPPPRRAMLAPTSCQRLGRAPDAAPAPALCLMWLSNLGWPQLRRARLKRTDHTVSLQPDIFRARID
jgi:hypothetical protein